MVSLWICQGDEFELAKNNSLKIYKEVYDLAVNDIIIFNSIRLGLALNYSVFVCEIMDNKNDVYDIVQKAYNGDMKVVDVVEKDRTIDNLLIIQLLKKNLNLWNNEIEGD